MSANPYKPPTSEVRDLPAAPGSPIKAIFLGLLVDIGGTTALSVLIGIVYMTLLMQSGLNQEQIGAAINSSYSNHSSTIFILSIIGGSVFSILGGYVCQRIAKRENYRIAYLMGSISVLMGLGLSGFNHSWTWHLAMGALTFVSILIGTKLARRGL